VFGEVIGEGEDIVLMTSILLASHAGEDQGFSFFGHKYLILPLTTDLPGFPGSRGMALPEKSRITNDKQNPVAIFDKGIAERHDFHGPHV